MTSHLFTDNDMAASLVRVAEITADFVGPKYWAAWCGGARAAASEELDRWVSSQHFDFNMDLRNLFLHPGSKHQDKVEPFLNVDADAMGAYFCRWLTVLARFDGSDPQAIALLFLEHSGGPPLDGFGYRRRLRLKIGDDDEL